MNGAMPLFDVILPTRGRTHTIGYAIASVHEQTEADFTLHVIGDGCGEKTEVAVRSFADPRVRYRGFPKAPGFGYANRNAVLRESSAPFVAYMSDDDLLFPDHLELGARALEEQSLELVAHSCAQVRYPDDLDPHFFAFDWRLGAASRFLRRWFVGAAHIVHRRRLFDRIGFWDESLPRFGDREFFQRACDSAERTSFRPDVTLLRFYAARWDGRYAGIARPPQEKYLALLRDPEWRADVRRLAASRTRSLPVRAGQFADFLSFAARSGPRFARLIAGRTLAASGLRGRRPNRAQHP
jgi:glycosyltransferase involved in cell wall biosynthesis